MRPNLQATREAARAALILLALAPGCGGGPPGPLEGGSPVVRPDSAEARKALAEQEAMIKDRQEQEARARSRRPGLPSDG